MTNEELLAVLNKRFDAIDERLDKHDKRFEEQGMRFDKMQSDVADMIEQQTLRIELKLENEVTKKIESLFDGYKLTHEKQWELEKKVERLEQRLAALETRVS